MPKKLLEELQEIYGIGPVAAPILVEKFNLNNKSPVRKQLCHPDIFPHLNKNTRADLIFNPSRKIPNSLIDKIAKDLKIRLHGVRHEVAGSYRRKKPYSQDIDLIVSLKSPTPAKYQLLIDKINKNNKLYQIVHVFGQGEGKVSAIMSFYHIFGKKTEKPKKPKKHKEAKNPKKHKETENPKKTQRNQKTQKTINIKMDIFITPPKEYMYMLLFATGSGTFNIRMRSNAKHKGYLLNQRGLFKNGVRQNIKTEHQLFKFLNMKWLEPENRVL